MSWPDTIALAAALTFMGAVVWAVERNPRNWSDEPDDDEEQPRV